MSLDRLDDEWLGDTLATAFALLTAWILNNSVLYAASIAMLLCITAQTYRKIESSRAE